MAEIANQEQLEAWLKGRSREVVLAIASRSALRIAPLIADYVGRYPRPGPVVFALRTFRDLAATWLAVTWLSPDTKVLASEIDDRDFAIIAARAAAGGGTRVATDLGADASAVATAADAAFAATAARAVAADTTINTRVAAYVAAHVAETTRDRAALWAEVTADREAIETGLLPGAMMRRPLWNSAAPETIHANWTRLKDILLGRDEDWLVWTEWYDDRLRGADHAASRPLIMELELRRTMISDEDWEKGAKHVNALIAALETEYRANPPSVGHDVIDPDEIEAPEAQTPFAVRFASEGDDPIGVDSQIARSGLLDDAAARDRHAEVVRRCKQMIGSFDPSERGANTATELVEEVRLFVGSLGEEPGLANPDLLVPRGDALRDIRDRYESFDEFSDLPQISDKYRHGLDRIVSAHNNYVSLDPELASRDEGLLGPDARKNIVAPLEGQEVIRDAVERHAAKPEVEDVLAEESRVTPEQADSENRKSRRYSESVKNFARAALARALALAKLSWKYKGRIVATGTGSYCAAQWVLANEAWLLKTFSYSPKMIETIARIIEVLKTLPLA